MPEDSSRVSVESLLADYHQVQKQRRTARYLMTLLIAAIVFIFILLGVSAVQNFHENDTDEFAIALGVEAATMSPMVIKELRASTNRAVPKIQEAIAQTFSENEELYVVTLTDNYIALQSYAQARWPLIEQAIAELVVKQEDTARTALSDYISEDKLQDLSLSYEAALSAYMEGFFANNFSGEMVTAEEMVENLQKLAETEPDLPPADSQYLMGMFLELLGLQMQENIDL